MSHFLRLEEFCDKSSYGSPKNLCHQLQVNRRDDKANVGHIGRRQQFPNGMFCVVIQQTLEVKLRVL